MMVSMIAAVIFVPTLCLVFLVSLGANVPPGPEASRFRPAPFDRFANKTSNEVVVKAWAERGVTLYLPTWLPYGLKSTGVWVVLKDGEVGSLAIFTYDSNGRGGIGTAQLVIQVARMPADIPFSEKWATPPGSYTRINGWEAYIDSGVSVNYPEYSAEYGTGYCELVDVQIGPLDYTLGGAPPLTMEDMIRIVESMEPTP